MAKKINPAEQLRIKQRKEFVQANPDLDPAVARQRFFVQTRVQELTKSGVEVTKERRAALREKFASGDIARKGFLTPQDIQRSKSNNNNNSNNSNNRTQGVLGPVVLGPPAPITTSSTTSASPSTSTATSSVAPKKDRNPFNDPNNPFNKANLNKFKDEIAKNFKDYKGSKTQKAVSFVGDFLEVPTFVKVAKFAGGTALAAGDSFNATFVNPAANLVGQKVFNKNPNLREAGPVEAAISTADLLATIYSAGGSKVIGTAVTSAAKKLNFRQAEKTFLTKAESAAARSQASKDAAQSVFDQAPGKNKVTPKPEPEFISGGLDDVVPFKNKPNTKKPKTKPSSVTEVKGEKAIPKPTSKKTKAPKVESADPVVGKTDKDLAPYSDTASTAPIEMSSTQVPKTQPTPDLAPDITPAVGSSKKVEWVRPKSTASTPTPANQLADKNSAIVTEIKAKAKKGKNKTRNAKKAEAETPKTNQVTSSVESVQPKPNSVKTNKGLSRPITGSKKAPIETNARAGIEFPTTTKFVTQQGFDNWAATGGKEQLKELARTKPNELIAFQKRNIKFLKSREAAKQASKDLANKAEVDAAKKAIAHANAVKAGKPETSPAVQEAAKLKAAEVPTALKPKVESAPAKKKSKSKNKTPKALNNLLMGRGGL